MKYKIEILTYGEKAILINWPQCIDTQISEELLLVKKYISEVYVEQLLDISNGYQSLLLYFKEAVSLGFLERLQTELEHKQFIKEEEVEKLWKIPICYDVDFGLDLTVFLKEKQLTLKELIQLHTEPIYHVYGKGFLPGFLYLGGLNEKLYLPRKKTPNLRIPKNSVAIGGEQTGIYPSASPGGWYVLGRTPTTLFNIEKTPPSVIKAGDKVKFYAISKEEFIKFKTSKAVGIG